MKYFVILLILVWHTLFASEILWYQDLNKAKMTAEKAHKNLMVMVEGEHCRWCKKMRYRTLSDERVAEMLSKRYICVRIDETSPLVMSKLPPVSGVPTIFFMTPDLTLIAASLGYKDAKAFLDYLLSIQPKQM